MRWQVLLLSTLVAGEAVASTTRDNFGPQNCVTLSKSQAGTCVMKTNCDGIDTSEFDFSFVCLSREGDKETQVKHEFGKGGFDSDEDYDTTVSCDECLTEPRVAGNAPATPADAHAQLQQYSAAKAQATTQPTPPNAAAFYGPGGCIATYRSPDGTCVVQTRCSSQEMQDYNYGLTCVDKENESTRHLFGKNSFDAEETFDTLVECKLCLGLDGSEKTSGNATDGSLAEQVDELKEAVQDIKKDVEGIKEKLGMPVDAGKEEPAAEGNATDTNATATGFLRRFRHHYVSRSAHDEDKDDKDDHVEEPKHRHALLRREGGHKHHRHHHDEDLEDDEDLDDEDFDAEDRDADEADELDDY